MKLTILVMTLLSAQLFGNSTLSISQLAFAQSVTIDPKSCLPSGGVHGRPTATCHENQQIYYDDGSSVDSNGYAKPGYTAVDVCMKACKAYISSKPNTNQNSSSSAASGSGSNQKSVNKSGTQSGGGSLNSPYAPQVNCTMIPNATRLGDNGKSCYCDTGYTWNGSACTASSPTSTANNNAAKNNTNSSESPLPSECTGGQISGREDPNIPEGCIDGEYPGDPGGAPGKLYCYKDLNFHDALTITGQVKSLSGWVGVPCVAPKPPKMLADGPWSKEAIQKHCESYVATEVAMNASNPKKLVPGDPICSGTSVRYQTDDDGNIVYDKTGKLIIAKVDASSILTDPYAPPVPANTASETYINTSKGDPTSVDTYDKTKNYESRKDLLNAGKTDSNVANSVQYQYANASADEQVQKDNLKSDTEDLAAAKKAGNQSRVNELKAEIKEYKANLAADQKTKAAITQNQTMQDADDAKKKGCGQYGAASCDTTTAINAIASIGDMVGSQIGQQAVSNTGATANAQVAAKGQNATASDFNAATVKTAKATSDQENLMIKVDTVAAIGQSVRLYQHATSAGKVTKVADAQRGNVENALDTTGDKVHNNTKFGEVDTTNHTAIQNSNTYGMDNQGQLSAKNRTLYSKTLNETESRLSAPCATQAGTPQACLDRAHTQAIAAAKDAVAQNAYTNIDDNAGVEIAAQQKAVTTQIVALATTANNLLKHVYARKAADLVANTTVPSSGAGFSFNPGSTSQTTDGVAASATPDTGTVVANTDNSNPSIDPGTPQFNPGGDGNGGLGAPPAGGFTPGLPGGAGGPPSGLAGSGATGNTSAAKDDGATPPGAKPKADAVGSYSAGDGSGSSFSRSQNGAGGGVGMDTGFADLLKKLLPGEEGDKGKQNGAVAFNPDRTPASDQAAVIGRNKNIFEEIHKRYEKKNTEGAIVFQI